MDNSIEELEREVFYLADQLDYYNNMKNSDPILKEKYNKLEERYFDVLASLNKIKFSA